MKINKKFLILTIFVIVSLVILSVFLYKNLLKKYRVSKGFEVYGNLSCDKIDAHFKSAGDALTTWKCGICGKSYVNPDTAVPQICEECALIMNRCEYCGKLK